MFKRTLLAAVSAALLLGTVSVTAKTPTIEDKVLRAGTDSSFAPFEFMGEKEFEGFDIDLIKAIGKELGYNVIVQNMGFDATIPALQSRNIDVIIAAMTITPERKKVVQFSDPYYTSGLIILVPENNTSIHSIKDLEGKKIAAQIGTTGMFKAEKIPGAQVKTYANASETFLEFENGGVDAVIQDYPVVAYYLSQKKKGKMVGEKMEAEEYGIAVAKNNKALTEDINKAMAKLKANGEYAKIYKKWFGEEPPK